MCRGAELMPLSDKIITRREGEGCVTMDDLKASIKRIKEKFGKNSNWHSSHIVKIIDEEMGAESNG